MSLKGKPKTDLAFQREISKSNPKTTFRLNDGYA
uniref:Uncharacterized protein n=1 Tax=Vibrio parahaemolyticus TaxID=670 RepID=A0A0C5HD99_VIBPH|nr:hypothetical protein pVPH1_0218 [Vibrio parahaemolyticus]